MGADESFSSGLKRKPGEDFLSGRILIVAAHPDDEVIGAGAQMPGMQARLDIVHVTDGSPDSLADAHRARFSTREEYAEARRREVLNAVALAGVPEHRCHQFGLTDQRASLQMPDLTCKLVGLIHRLQPTVILTHPYEGGHPDHDACSLAVRAALDSIPEVDSELWEFTSYHARATGVETGVFLPPTDSTIECPLTAEQQALKRRMFECFSSQQPVLTIFNTDTEAFRPAPKYDFTEPPHPGRLHYEQYDWGVTGPRWRQLAAETLKQIGLD
jgi:LmbE family N-acetylglucosaminyl deacetylase